MGQNIVALTRTVCRCAAVAVLLLLAGCGGITGSGGTGASSLAATGSGTTAPGTSAAGPTTPPQSRALPVYYVADTPVGSRLYREFHAVPSADPPSDAVREMLAKPAGIDPDYRSHWPAGTRLRSAVGHTGGVITVDLSGEASSAQVGSELAELTVQQLVYTVQGAMQATDPVRILVDGAAVAQLWGHVSTAQPVQRADPYQTRSLVQIDNPAHGAAVGHTFVVSGEAAAFEANVPWEVLRDAAVVSSGAATAAEGQRFSAFSFSLTLDPGDYTVRITEDDPSDGAGRPPFTDSKLVHVGS